MLGDSQRKPGGAHTLQQPRRERWCDAPEDFDTELPADELKTILLSIRPSLPNQQLAEEAAGLGGADVTIENYKELVDTELVMKEALRLSPPVPFSPRGVLRDTEIAGVPLRAGQMVTLASLGLHRHPDWWTAPDVFDPQRFAPERAEDRAHSHLYVPFGGGAHICLGNHLAELMTKAVTAAVLAEHRVRARRGQTMEMAAVPIPKPKGNLRLQLA